MVIGLASNKIEYTAGSKWCFLSSEDHGKWYFGLFLVPLYISLFVGVALSVSNILHLSKHEKVMQNAAMATGAQSQNRQFRLKTLALLITTFLDLVFLASFSAYSLRYEKDIRASVLEYPECLFRQYTLGLQGVTVDLGCRIDPTPSFALLIMANVFLAFNGTFLFFLFGFQDTRLLAKQIFSQLGSSTGLKPSMLNGQARTVVS